MWCGGVGWVGLDWIGLDWIRLGWVGLGTRFTASKLRSDAESLVRQTVVSCLVDLIFSLLGGMRRMIVSPLWGGVG